MKPKREITLGEMQDECKKHTVVEKNGSRVTNCSTCDPVIMSVCKDIGRFSENTFIIPGSWNLTDPPRFTEAQMALLKALWDFGIRSASNCGGGNIYFYRLESEPVLAVIDTRLLDENDIDLAELFGKEAHEKRKAVENHTDQTQMLVYDLCLL